ncbi:MAG: ribonuclease HII [Acidobacteria bacterium]|nr:MAG: ribonuclease HII [Acidobacteriota bacterium]REK03026.1 MAG: ribonuclease HII [Acidobacteriota bacterium]REK13170.1 MAG: ribonuclease HII [Acidobacteriota bacterium]REK41164.1 MAG: ribonuclease HII [Acidobacteriota bacterium]
MSSLLTVKFDFEAKARADGFSVIAGVDEVGRGCLAGSVVAAAVVFESAESVPEGVDDSKKLSKARREELAERIKETALTFAFAESDNDVVDEINVLEATKRAMLSAVGKLDPAADFLLIDAVRLNASPLAQRSIIKGDSASASIAAASIIAKVHRDALMKEFDSLYPQYGFSRHVGYGTPEHLEAIRVYGPCPIHRKTFRGVNQLPLGF